MLTLLKTVAEQRPVRQDNKHPKTTQRKVVKVKRGSSNLLQRLLVWFWFTITVGMMARLGDDFRLYLDLRQRNGQLQSELQMLDHQISLLQNKLRYLYTSDGIRLVRRTQFYKSSGEKLFVFEDGLPPISVMDLLAGGFEEWGVNKRAGKPERNRWLVRLSRHWQRLRSEQRY